MYVWSATFVRLFVLFSFLAFAYVSATRCLWRGSCLKQPNWIVWHKLQEDVRPVVLKWDRAWVQSYSSLRGPLQKLFRMGIWLEIPVNTTIRLKVCHTSYWRVFTGCTMPFACHVLLSIKNIGLLLLQTRHKKQ